MTDLAEFEAYCGVGVKVPREDIQRAVAGQIELHKETIITERYHYSIGPLLAKVREQYKWADGKVIKEETEEQIAALLGPKTAADLEPVKVRPTRHT